MDYFYFYKITNNINGHYYYGIHKTSNLNDGYMGSGSRLHKAFEKYGIENFTKEIIKFFNTLEEAYEYEALIVNEDLISLDECYNIQLGGQYFSTKNHVVCTDANGNKLWVDKNDEKYNTIYFPVWKGKHHKLESRNKTRNTMSPKKFIK